MYGVPGTNWLVFISVADPDPHPDPLVRDMDPDPYVLQQNFKKNIDSYCFVTSL
jgi:hypothetical protein